MPDFLEGQALEAHLAPRRAEAELLELTKAARRVPFNPLAKAVAGGLSTAASVKVERLLKNLEVALDAIAETEPFSTSNVWKAARKDLDAAGLAVMTPTSGKAAGGGELRKRASTDIAADAAIADAALQRIERALPVSKGISASFVRGALLGLKKTL